MKTFQEIAQRGSLTAAASAMDRSLPSVVRTLATLEEALGVRLLNRTTRRISLTDEGSGYLRWCQKILADVAEAELALAQQQTEPEGHLHVTASVMFGKMHVAPLVTQFTTRFPNVEVDILLLDRVVNMVEEGLDVGVRIGHLSDSSMIAIPIGHVRRVVCASPGFLAALDPISHPGELSKHSCVRFTGIASRSHWNFVDRGKPLSVPVSGPLVCNQAPAIIDACVAGLGFGMFLSYMIEPLVEEKKLVVVLSEYETDPLPVHLIYHQARLMSARVRVFVDWMKDNLRPRLPPLAGHPAGS